MRVECLRRGQRGQQVSGTGHHPVPSPMARPMAISAPASLVKTEAGSSPASAGSDRVPWTQALIRVGLVTKPVPFSCIELQGPCPWGPAWRGHSHWVGTGQRPTLEHCRRVSDAGGILASVPGAGRGPGQRPMVDL